MGVYSINASLSVFNQKAFQLPTKIIHSMFSLVVVTGTSRISSVIHVVNLC